MITSDSILRQLPPGLNRKQAFFFDGIRHAAEIVWFAYSRLQSTLTDLAFERVAPIDYAPVFTSAFLDAWAIVDSIDRLRSLLNLVPVPKAPRSESDPLSFDVVTADLRNLRNVADHLAQRADYVLANKTAALGVLSWVTILDSELPKIVSCTIDQRGPQIKGVRSKQDQRGHKIKGVRVDCFYAIVLANFCQGL